MQDELEDWRYGPLGKIGRMKTTEELEAELRAEEEIMSGSSATVTTDTSSRSPCYRTAEPLEGDEDWRHGPCGSDEIREYTLTTYPSAESTRSLAADVQSDHAAGEDLEGAPEAEETAEELLERFQRVHNAPSTPAQSLTGEVRDRTIWAYWAQGYDAMPEFFKLCVETWRMHNPHWDVRILDRHSVHEFLSEVELPNRFQEISSPQTASDCVRLAVLSRYGGVWLDASVLLCSGLDGLCWHAISQGSRSAAAFFTPRYGTEAFGRRDFVETWCLATLPGNPFFLRWRDLLRELLHNRVGVDGLLRHPLYHDLNLEGFAQLNEEFPEVNHDFREHLAVHAMFHRLIQTSAEAQRDWNRSWALFDASDNALLLQHLAAERGVSVCEMLLQPSAEVDSALNSVPALKLTTPQYKDLLLMSRERLLNEQVLLGRLLRGRVSNVTPLGLGVSQGVRRMATVPRSLLRPSSRLMSTIALAGWSACRMMPSLARGQEMTSRAHHHRLSSVALAYGPRRSASSFALSRWSRLGLVSSSAKASSARSAIVVGLARHSWVW